jgi:putative FmdB family regulatory protein
MPIYEYRCAACGHELEALQRFSDAPLVTCPACGKPNLTKLLSAAGFQLKGSGWYATDFKNSGSKPAAKEKAPAEGSTAAGESKDSAAASETKGDAKTDSKADTKSSEPAAKPAADKPAGTAGSSTAGS